MITHQGTGVCRRCFISAFQFVVLGLALTALTHPVFAIASSKEDKVQVRDWNRFASILLDTHNKIVRGDGLRQKEEIGGYYGLPDFYREVSTFDEKNGRLLSRIRWERKNPDRMHDIELFYYDKKGRLSREYSASFLARYRNAPRQTLVNLYSYNGDLTAMRQFDASGTRIFEHCRGTWFDKPVVISLEEPLIATPDELLSSEAYMACFGFLPDQVGKYLDPLLRKASLQKDAGEIQSGGDKEMMIAMLNLKLRLSPKRASLYLDRGNAYLSMLDFDNAIADFTRCIELDNSIDYAYFGRGMARGRIRMIDEGIADLSVFIKRNPLSSLAYTKRGVRYIWKGDFKRAEIDLRHAIKLDPRNAEANDDLGVILARRKDYKAALTHFNATIRLEPSYQKAHHNKALVLQLLGRHDEALSSIDTALNLGQDTVSSVRLKAAVLESLGRKDEAQEFRRKAENAPQKDWSENLALD